MLIEIKCPLIKASKTFFESPEANFWGVDFKDQMRCAKQIVDMLIYIYVKPSTDQGEIVVFDY